MSDEATAVAAPGAPAAVWEDFIDIFYAPTAVFDRRRHWSAWPVLLVLTVVLGLLFFAWQRALGPVLDLEMQRAAAEAVAQSGEMGEEQLAQMRSMGRLFGLLGFVIAFPVGVLIIALMAWAAARAMGSAVAFTAMVMVVTYSQMVRIPQYAAGMVQGAVLDVNRMDSVHDVSLSLARFLDQPEASTAMVGLAARVDLFTLWATALIAIGLHVVADLSRGRAWAAALLVWLLAAAPSLVAWLVSG